MLAMRWPDNLPSRKVGAAAAAVLAAGAWFGSRRWKRQETGQGLTTGRRALGQPVQPQFSHWGFDVQELKAIAQRGREIYERHSQELEAEHLHKSVFINVDTGEYVVGGTFRDAHRAFIERFGDAPSWDTRVGDADYGFDRTRIVQ
jgi:hypothetical protein